MYGPPFWFLTNDRAGRDIALSHRRWDQHIKANHPWFDEGMIPAIRETIENPDKACESDRNSHEAEFWRRYVDTDGTSDYLMVVVRYDTLIQSAVSGDVVTAYYEVGIDCRGAVLWTR